MESTLNPSDMALDGMLALGLLALAWTLLRTPDLFKAIVLFISFGLIMSLAWVRLKAVDIALAEAAIGAGLTGALFLSARSKMHPKNPGVDSAEDGRTPSEKDQADNRNGDSGVTGQKNAKNQ